MSLADTRAAGQAVPGVQVARAWSAACVRNEGKARADTAPVMRREREGARQAAETARRWVPSRHAPADRPV